MFHVYVLRSESTHRLYIGSTSDLQRRLAEHHANMAVATKNRGPWELVYSEEHATRSSAVRRERYLKTGRGRAEIQGILSAGDRMGR